MQACEYSSETKSLVYLLTGLVVGDIYRVYMRQFNKFDAALTTVVYVIIWRVSSSIPSSICFAIVGLGFGCVFPGAFGLATDMLPQEMHLVAMAIL